jgi:hypothetical protein
MALVKEQKDEGFKLTLPIKIKYQPEACAKSKPYLGSALQSLENMRESFTKTVDPSIYLFDENFSLTPL